MIAIATSAFGFLSAFGLRISGFGFLSDFGLRISDLPSPSSLKTVTDVTPDGSSITPDAFNCP